MRFSFSTTLSMMHLCITQCTYCTPLTIKLSFDVALLTLKLRSALTHLGDANTVVLQRNCSMSLHSNCLGRCSNPYYPRYRQSTLTKRSPCHITRSCIQ